MTSHGMFRCTFSGLLFLLLTSSLAARAAAPVITQGAGPLSVTMSEDGAPTPWNAPTLGATDADGDTLTWSVATAASHGTAAVAGTGISPAAFTYAPNANWNGADSFTVQVSDGNGGADTIAINVTVQAVNDAPQFQVPAAPVYVSQWGSQGDPPAGFNWPCAIALDSAGIVYVSDLYNSCVHKFDSSGNSLGLLASYGSGNGQVKYPAGIAIAGSGTIYIVDSGNNRIQKFDAAGNYLAQWGTQGSGDGQFITPKGIALDSAGNVYVVDANNHRIQKFDASGNYLTQWGSGGYEDNQFASPTDVAIDSANTVYVADFGADLVKKFDSNGVFLGKWGGSGSGDGQFTGPSGIMADPSGLIYVTEMYANSRVQIFDTNGGYLGQFGGPGSGDGQFSQASDTAMDRFGYAYVVDNMNYRIQKFSTRSAAPTTLSVTMSEDASPTPFHIALYAADADGELPAWSLLSQAGHGTATVAGTGPIPSTLTYVPAANWSGSDGFVIQVSDGHGATDTITINVTVEAVDDMPVIAQGDGPLTVSMSEDGAPTAWVAPALSATDNDAGNTLTWSVSVPAGNGLAEVSGTGASPSTFVYFPDPNWNGADSFTVQVSDNNGNIDTIVVEVTVGSVDDLPAIDQGDGPLTVAMSEDGAPTAWSAPELSATDGDGASDTLTWSVSVPASHGVAAVSGQGATPSTFDYAPNADWNGSDAFTVRVSDSTGNTDTIVVNVNVEAVGDAPQILAPSIDGVRVNYETQWGGLGSGIGQFQSPSGIAMDRSGNLYVADAGNYRIQKFDSAGNYITQWGENGYGAAQFDTPCAVAIDQAGLVYVLENNNNRIQKFDSDGNYLATLGSFGADEGRFNYPQGFTVDPLDNVYVADTLSNRIQKLDLNGNFLAQWGTAGSGDGQFSSPWAVTADGLGNVYVADSQNNRIQKFDSNGTFLAQWGTAGTGDGQINQPWGIASDAHGNVYVADTWNHQVQKFDTNGRFIMQWGGQGGGDGQFLIPEGIALDTHGAVFVVDSANHRIQQFRQWGPSATCAVTMSEDGAPKGFALTLYGTDADGDTPLMWSVTGAASHGTADLAAPGADNSIAVLYAPQPNYVGGDRFDVSITDGHDGVSTITVQVALTPVSDGGPVIDQGAGPLNVTMSEDGAPTPWVAPALSATDPDPENILTWSVYVPASHGTATVSGTGASPSEFTYAPDANWNGTDFFWVQVSDGTDNTDLITVNVTVTAVVDVPVIDQGDGPLTVTMSEDGAPTPWIAPTLSATQGDGLTMTWSMSVPPNHGLAAVSGTGASPSSFSYIPYPNWSGADSFTVQVSDSKGGTDTVVIEVTVEAVNDGGPVIDQSTGPLQVTMSEDGVPTAWSAPLLSATDPDGPDTITWSVATPPATGVADVSGTGASPTTFTYTPAANWSGADSFVVQVTDNFGVGASITINVTVQAVNDAPQIFVSSIESPTYVGQWSGSGLFNHPYGLATDNADNVYVADWANSRIVKFDSNGSLLTVFAYEGAGAGQLEYPEGVAVDSSGAIYIADTNNNRVEKLDANGIYITQWGSLGTGPGQFSHPVGIAVDASGNVYVADTQNNRIEKFDTTGALTALWGGQGSSNGQLSLPQAVAVDNAGNVYVSDQGNQRVQKFDSDGSFITKWAQNGPFGIAADASGYVYVVEFYAHHVQVFDSNGNYVGQWGGQGDGDGQFVYPFGIAVDTSGDIYVSDTGNNRIQKFRAIQDAGALLNVTMSENGAPVAWSAPTLVATDTENDPLTWSVSSPASHGTATLSGTGASPTTFTYAPTANWSGEDSFTVQVADGNGGADTVIVNVSVSSEGEGEGGSQWHTADQNHNNLVSLSELLRVIQFFNSHGYHCQAGTEDGYAPGPGSETCTPHDSDYNPQDWQVKLGELLRVIQFFNSHGYHYCPDQNTEDGFCPGP